MCVQEAGVLVLHTIIIAFSSCGIYDQAYPITTHNEWDVANKGLGSNEFGPKDYIFSE